MAECMKCRHGSVCEGFQGEHSKDCEFFLPESEWISVKERLPEQGGEYLVYTESGDMFNAGFDENCGENGEFGYWQGYHDAHSLGFLDSEWQPYDAVTHWMPLPEPPGEEDNDG